MRHPTLELASIGLIGAEHDLIQAGLVYNPALALTT